MEQDSSFVYMEQDLNERKIRRVLVTGGSGFIGTNLLDFYLSRKTQVLNLDIASPRNLAHIRFWRKVDLLDKNQLRDEIHTFSPTHVFDMGARTDLNGKDLNDYGANIQGVRNLINVIHELPSIQRVIFASSRLVCKIGYQPKDEFDYCPTTSYGESKILGEKIVRDSKHIHCSWIIIRPTSIWGPWFDIPYKTFFLAIARGWYSHPGNYNINKSFGFVGNGVFQLHKLMIAPTKKVDRKTFYLADYLPINVKDMADRIQKTMGVKRIRILPISILKMIAMGGDILKYAGWRDRPLTRFRLDNLLTEMVYDLTPLKDIVGELPYSLDEGIKITVDWMRRNGEIE